MFRLRADFIKKLELCLTVISILLKISNTQNRYTDVKNACINPWLRKSFKGG